MDSDLQLDEQELNNRRQQVGRDRQMERQQQMQQGGGKGMGGPAAAGGGRAGGWGALAGRGGAGAVTGKSPFANAPGGMLGLVRQAQAQRQQAPPAQQQQQQQQQAKAPEGATELSERTNEVVREIHLLAETLRNRIPIDN